MSALTPVKNNIEEQVIPPANSNVAVAEAPVEAAQAPEASPEQRAAQFAMFAQGANNGGVVQNRVLEEAEEVKAPVREVTDLERQQFIDLQSGISRGIITNQANVVKFYQLKTGQVDQNVYQEFVNSRVQEANLSTDGKLLFDHLSKFFTIDCVANWSKVLTPLFSNPAQANQLVKAIVEDAIIGQMKTILDDHININPQYLGEIRKIKQKEDVLVKTTILLELLNTITLDEVKTIKNLLVIGDQENGENQPLSGKGENVFDAYLTYFGTLNEEDLRIARECISDGFKARIEKG